MVGAIVEEADYRGAVDDQEFSEAEEALGRPLPDEWRRYLQGESWFRRGWMATGTYVWLNSPSEMVEVHDAWDDATDAHPGIAVIGDNGSREQFVLDLRGDPAPVLLVDLSSDGWDGAIRQADTVGEFIDRVEAGTFAIDFGEAVPDEWGRPMRVDRATPRM
ncbi:SMI1/KNR4 family protein [Micromonospora krabiensis]|uniref:SMI1/KNR4 family protein n=1 Tax=Micromonospora krabiensis TaxID=307121 RepID=UPI00361A653E